MASQKSLGEKSMPAKRKIKKQKNIRYWKHLRFTAISLTYLTYYCIFIYTKQTICHKKVLFRKTEKNQNVNNSLSFLILFILRMCRRGRRLFVSTYMTKNALLAKGIRKKSQIFCATRQKQPALMTVTRTNC